MKEFYSAIDKFANKKLVYDDIIKGYLQVYGSKRPTKEILDIITRIKDHEEGLFNWENFCLIFYEKKQNIYLKGLENELKIFDRGFVGCKELIEILSDLVADDNAIVNRIIQEVESFSLAVTETVYC